jgi:DNA-binding response OmpR family regulator
MIRPRATNAAGQDNILTGRRILIVEDRYLLAKEAESMLRRWGCEPVGPAADLAGAFALLTRDVDSGGGRLDAAVLDVHLSDAETVFPLAEELRRRGVPFLFATGYGSPAIPDAWRAVPRIEKPFAPRDLAAALRALFAADASRGGNVIPLDRTRR